MLKQLLERLRKSKKVYYTIFLGNNIWENVIDDMNADRDWAMGGMMWEEKEKALECMEYLKRYNFESRDKKFTVKKLELR
jgi:hypothetical protein